MHVFETPGSVSLQVKLPSGRVLVTTADQPSTTVEVVAVGRRGQDAIDEIEVTLHDRLGRHVVKVEQRDRFRWGPIQITWGGGFECRVVCPPGTDLEFSGGSTDLRVEGELGEVSVRTASGDIRLESVRRELEVKTASGDISVDTIASEASLMTVSGHLGVERVDASLTARSVSGGATIGSISGPLGLCDDVGKRRPQGGFGRRRARQVGFGRHSRRDLPRDANLGRRRRRCRDASNPSSGSTTRSRRTRRATTSSPCTSRPSAATCRSFGRLRRTPT